MQPVVQALEEMWESEKTGIRLKEIDQVLIIFNGPVTSEVGEQLLDGPVIEVRMNEPTDFAKFAEFQGMFTIDDFIEHLKPTPPFSEMTEEQRQLVRADETIRQIFMLTLGEEDGRGSDGAMDVLDDRTMLYGMGTDLHAAIRDRKSLGLPTNNSLDLPHDDIALMVNVEAFRPYLDEEFAENPDMVTGMFVPMWQNTDAFVGGVSFADQFELAASLMAKDDESAEKVNQSLRRLVPTGQSALQGFKAAFKKNPQEMHGAILPMLNFAESFLDNVVIRQADNHVEVTYQGDGASLALTAAVTLPALQQAREAARRTQTRNNLKVIGVAFHNFHDVYGHFPPPVLYGKQGDGKSQHPHSWRVAILPYVGAAELYNQYHFDEPWDSEHNKTILEQTPAVFRSEKDGTGSTNAAYFALVGKQTAVGERPRHTGQPTEGVKIREITDTTSNTLVIVEAKRDIPWTKPEDISHSSDKDLPKFGGWHDGGFHALRGDGSVTFISQSIDENLLRALITRDGGETIQIE